MVKAGKSSTLRHLATLAKMNGGCPGDANDRDDLTASFVLGADFVALKPTVQSRRVRLEPRYLRHAQHDAQAMPKL